MEEEEGTLLSCAAVLTQELCPDRVVVEEASIVPLKDALLA